MKLSREFLTDKGFDIAIGAPLGGAAMYGLNCLWGALSWQIWVAGILVCVSAVGFVEFLRHENRKRTTLPQPGPHPCMDGRKSFVGRWQLGVGDGCKEDFIAELYENGDARRFGLASFMVREAVGSWEYVEKGSLPINGVARIKWSDGWTDVLEVTKTGHAPDGTEHSAQAVKLSDKKS